MVLALALALVLVPALVLVLVPALMPALMPALALVLVLVLALALVLVLVLVLSPARSPRAPGRTAGWPSPTVRRAGLCIAARATDGGDTDDTAHHCAAASLALWKPHRQRPNLLFVLCGTRRGGLSTGARKFWQAGLIWVG